MGYEINIIKGKPGWDESNWCVAECASLPGCFSQGKLREEAMASIKDAIGGYLASLKKHNDKIPPQIARQRKGSPLLKLLMVSGVECVDLFKKIGYEVDVKTEHHTVLRFKDSPYRRLTIPNHSKLAMAMTEGLIIHSGLTVRHFIELMRKKSSD